MNNVPQTLEAKLIRESCVVSGWPSDRPLCMARAASPKARVGPSSAAPDGRITDLLLTASQGKSERFRAERGIGKAAYLGYDLGHHTPSAVPTPGTIPEVAYRITGRFGGLPTGRISSGAISYCSTLLLGSRRRTGTDVRLGECGVGAKVPSHSCRPVGPLGSTFPAQLGALASPNWLNTNKG